MEGGTIISILQMRTLRARVVKSCRYRASVRSGILTKQVHPLFLFFLCYSDSLSTNTKEMLKKTLGNISCFGKEISHLYL